VLWSRLFLTILVIFGCPYAFAQERCAAIFGSSSASAISPVSLDHAVDGLARLKLKIDLAQAQGASGAHMTLLKKNYSTKAQEILRYLETHGLMTGAELKSRIQDKIAQLQLLSAREKEENQEREKQRDETEDLVIGSRIQFNSVAPGSFEMGEVRVHTEITKPFEMAATLTTQVVWWKIAALAKKRYPGQYNELNVDPSTFKGDDSNPVETVSYNDIQLWLKAANALLKARDSEALKLIQGYREGTILRLPTEAEWEFVVLARGAANGLYYFGGDETKFAEYAWTLDNAGLQTHPVGQKQPLVIDGKEFYDLLGNVWELTDDLFFVALKGGKDPKGYEKKDTENRVIRGGSWLTPNYILKSRYRDHNSSLLRHYETGFRLVRVEE
jgi:formylglycine-generating enzyme required for sulfatase activity